MGKILVNSESVQIFRENVNKEGSELSGEFRNLYEKLLEEAKDVIKSNNGSTEYIDEMINNLSGLHRNFLEFLNDFGVALSDIISNYQNVDQETTQNISMIDDTIAAVSIGAGGLTAGGFDFGKISRTAKDAADGNFINESKVHNNAFGEGEYTFQYREDGTVRVDKDGVPMAFTTKENADKITGGLDKKVETESKSESEQGSAETPPKDSSDELDATAAEPLKTPANEQSNDQKGDTNYSFSNDFFDVAEQVKKEREQDITKYGNGPWSGVTIEKKTGGFYDKNDYIVQQTTYRDGANKKTMVVLASGKYVTVPGGKVDSVSALNTTLFNSLSPEEANSMLTYETRMKIYKHQQNNQNE